MVAYVRTVKTSSAATAVQIVWSSRRGSRNIEHIGSAHDDAELEALKAAARQRLAAGQMELDLGLGGPGPAAPLEIASSRMSHLWNALCRAYDALGFPQATGSDEVFRQNQANRAFADAEARNAANPAYEPYPAGAPRHIGLVAEAVLAWRAEIRTPRRAPGTSPESAGVTMALIWMRTETLESIARDPQALRLCDGCYQAATGLIAEYEDDCEQDPRHTGLCLRDGPDDCQWCGKQDRLREVPRSGIARLLPTAGESGEGLWHLHFTDGAQGPYPSQRAAWDYWHASSRAGDGGTGA